jgi:hypothetical protein
MSVQGPRSGTPHVNLVCFARAGELIKGTQHPPNRGKRPSRQVNLVSLGWRLHTLSTEAEELLYRHPLILEQCLCLSSPTRSYHLLLSCLEAP